MRQEHIPVLLLEVIDALQVRPGNKYIDATVGLGGHTKEIVNKGGNVLGIDRDPETIEKLRISNVKTVVGSFANIGELAKQNGFLDVDGILFDLGYSSWQLDKSGRGFTYTKDEPLDMRFNPKTQEIQARDVVNKMPKNELIDVISTFGEEEQAEKIVEHIIRSRPIATTGELSKILEKAVTGQDRQRHKARVFQALRIAVNNELGSLKKALPEAVAQLKKDGRLAVISFHSLEDRIVKQFLKEQEGKTLRIINKKPIIASREETYKNSRSKSAKLRIAQKI
jgi:16S rRNA (cytosine1402-N4)-methyltransferase